MHRYDPARQRLALGLAGLAGLKVPFLGASAMAMGLANNVFSRDGEVTVGVTYMTGALVRFGQGVAARLAGKPLPGARGYGLLWSALALGAAAGGGLCLVAPAAAAITASTLALVLSINAARIEP